MSAATHGPRTDAITLLAFDFGTRNIGVAMGNTLLRAASPLTTIASEENAARFAAIAALIAEWQPGRLIVGRPVHSDGAEYEMEADVREVEERRVGARRQIRGVGKEEEEREGELPHLRSL